MVNYLDAASLLVSRLQQKLTIASTNIRPAPSLEWAIKNALSPSGVSVIFFDDVPEVTAGGSGRLGRSQASQQYWLILVSVRNVSDVGNNALLDTGKLLLEVLEALQGWPLSGDHLPLYRQKCPYRKTDREGWAHFPIMFSCCVTVTGKK